LLRKLTILGIVVKKYLDRRGMGQEPVHRLAGEGTINFLFNNDAQELVPGLFILGNIVDMI
jgi:hypothetical protein